MIIFEMRGHSQAVVAVLVAYAIMLVLVSPAVASPVTTMPTKHTLHPPNIMAPIAAILLVSSAMVPGLDHELALARPAHPTASGSQIVDLTTARLC